MPPSEGGAEPIIKELPDGNFIVGYLVDDSDCENPTEENGFKPYSFNKRHRNFKDPDQFFDEDRQLLPELQEKLKQGLAYILSYYEHGSCAWMLAGSPAWAACPDKRWDGTSVAGVLVWESDDPTDLPGSGEGEALLELRREYAEGVVKTYTDWCNGQVFGYVVARFNNDSQPQDDHDSLYGLIGFDYAKEAMEEAVEEMAGA